MEAEQMSLSERWPGRDSSSGVGPSVALSSRSVGHRPPHQSHQEYLLKMQVPGPSPALLNESVCQVSQGICI